jgi:hypothetical protein
MTSPFPEKEPSAVAAVNQSLSQLQESHVVKRNPHPAAHAGALFHPGQRVVVFFLHLKIFIPQVDIQIIQQFLPLQRNLGQLLPYILLVGQMGAIHSAIVLRLGIKLCAHFFQLCLYFLNIFHQAQDLIFGPVDHAFKIVQLFTAGIDFFNIGNHSTVQFLTKALAEELGLKKQAVLNQSGRERLLKLAVFVPLEHCEAVRNAMSEAGAGWIGNYSHCTFLTRGTGTFKPLQGTNPYIGKTGVVEHVDEIKIETVVPASRLEPVLQAMLEAHPYEEVAYDLYGLVNSGPAYGAGRLGELEETVSFLQFAEKVKSVLGLTALRLGGSFDSPVRKVAVCGGSGADFWQDALAAGADTFVTGDLKYHTAQDMLAAGLKFIDPGHFGTEAVVLPVLQRFLVSRCREKNMDVEIVLAQTNTDPFAYL